MNTQLIDHFLWSQVSLSVTDKYRGASQHDRCAYEISQHMNFIRFTFRPLITAGTLGSTPCRYLGTGSNPIYSESEEHLHKAQYQVVPNLKGTPQNKE